MASEAEDRAVPAAKTEGRAGSTADAREIYRHVDHTDLRQTARWEDIRLLCEEALAGGAASVCIPPCYVARARAYLGDRMPVCTVVGFPNGYQTTLVKLVETQAALAAGADEIDMVLNLCEVKDGGFDRISHEIHALRRACGRRVLKVIVETCFLEQPEKQRLCEIVTEAGADYIKTSTGFARGGATLEDVAYLRAHVGAQVKVKAAGGIRTLEDAARFLEAGADRLGSSGLLRGITRRRA